MGNKIMVEVACEPISTCNNDQRSFKAYLSNWLGTITQIAPEYRDTIVPYLIASAKGAAGQCSGGTDGMTCGREWNTTTWDGTYGVGEQMSALGAVQAAMLTVAGVDVPGPLTLDTGGTSKSDPSAGTGGAGSGSAQGSLSPGNVARRPITTSDRAGAGILTALVLCFVLGGTAWLLLSSE